MGMSCERHILCVPGWWCNFKIVEFCCMFTYMCVYIYISCMYNILDRLHIIYDIYDIYIYIVYIYDILYIYNKYDIW